MKRFLALEPALVRAVVTFVLLVAGVVGVNITTQVEGLETILLAAIPLVALIQGWWTRNAVTANGKVLEWVDGTQVVAGVANDLNGEGSFIRDYDPIDALPVEES